MNLCEVKNCSSCGACIISCPKQCISLEEDLYGYLYPRINTNECINCGKCRKVCHAINDVDFNYPKAAYAVWSLDAQDRITSTSGGAASVFYQTVLSKKGIGYGAIIDDNLNVIIKGYDNENISEFKNSKYVHSDMNTSYQNIMNELKEGKNVLFIGLPCQVAALKRYLGKSYSNLILIDIICHGTPPQKHLNEHIDYIDSKCKKKTKKIRFRNDNEFIFMNYTDEKSKPFYQKTKNADSYLLSFFESLNYYDSCYSCKYAQNKRVSDITIGDFWGLGIDEPFDHPYTGAISLVMTNTDKGEEFFANAKEHLFVEERTVQEALNGNNQLNTPSLLNANRESFLSLYKENGFEYAINTIYGSYMNKEEKVYNRMQKKIKFKRMLKTVLRR